MSAKPANIVVVRSAFQMEHSVYANKVIFLHFRWKDASHKYQTLCFVVFYIFVIPVKVYGFTNQL